ncbi:probable transcriptional regulator, TetR family [Alloactinosynnema sp. L-07]|uniref:TetR/AcrR family transcriptional regulator n=1 Tax=Alloactinosynnema sp. L-07 TaxID=1653480 RepID=UPI00065F08FB|nr:helix-turn-helix domain-containing protein [Alloactinosynnema sp. L-07]CRK58330.1 probable transcriptional regulator, TetR family [Alloactinosynnema sp. L-07]
MPRQINHATRRDAISDAVVAIAADHGFAAVTIRAVAKHVGASTSVVTHYVASRDELLRGAVRRELAIRQDEADTALAGLSGATGLRALVHWAVTDLGERVHRFWLALLIAAHAEPVLRAELNEFNTWWDTHLRDFVTESGVSSPEVVIDTLDVVIDGLVTAGFEAPFDAARRDRVLDRVWTALDL